VVAAVIGGLESGEAGVGLLVAGGLLSLGAGLGVLIWWPRWGWRFAISARTAIDEMLEERAGSEGKPSAMRSWEVYRERSLFLESDWESNEKRLGYLRLLLKGILGSVVVLVVVLVFAV
jgi:hypothetical protein